MNSLSFLSLTFLVIQNTAVTSGFTCQSTRRTNCSEFYCFEDYKKLVCDSNRYVYVESLEIANNSVKEICDTPHKKHKDDLHTLPVLLNKTREHCLYQSKCSVGFGRTNPKDECTYVMRPYVTQPFDLIWIKFSCRPIAEARQDIIDHYKNISSDLLCDKDSSGRGENKTTCFDDEKCSYPTCNQLNRTKDLVIHNFYKQCNRSSTAKFCEATKVGEKDFKGEYDIPKTTYPGISYIKCEYGSLDGSVEAYMNIRCVSILNKVMWAAPDFNKCAAKLDTTNELIKLKQLEKTGENVVNVTSSLREVTKNSSSITLKEEIDLVVDVMTDCLDVTKTDKNVNTNLLETVDSLLGTNEDVEITSVNQRKILSTMQKIGEGSMSANSSLDFSAKNIAFKNLVNQNFNPVSISAVKRDNLRHEILYDYHGNDVISSVIVSPDTFAMTGFADVVHMYFYSYEGGRILPMENGSIASSILDFSVDASNVNEINKEIIFTFYLQRQVEPSTSNIQCVFWKESKFKESWSNEGCKLSRVTHKKNVTVVTCRCNHLTNFAVLLNVGKARRDEVLSIISLVGCGLSIAGLMLTLLHLICLRRLLKSVASKILFNLSLSLLGLLLVFMIGVERVSDMFYCHIIASLIHFLTLTSFAWMAVQSVGLYRDVVRSLEYQGQSFNFIWISGVLAYGGPLIAAGITHYFSTDQFKEGEKETCTVTGDLSLIAIMLPVAIILLFNFSMFVPILRTIQTGFTMRSKFQSNRWGENFRRRVRVTFACTILLGLTWVFGLFAINDAKAVFEYIFAILNSLQGFFIFLCHTMNNREVQKTWQNAWSRLKNIPRKDVSNATEMTKVSASKTISK